MRWSCGGYGGQTCERREIRNSTIRELYGNFIVDPVGVRSSEAKNVEPVIIALKSLVLWQAEFRSRNDGKQQNSFAIIVLTK
jgi:hypothetical protein